MLTSTAHKITLSPPLNIAASDLVNGQCLVVKHRHNDPGGTKITLGGINTVELIAAMPSPEGRMSSSVEV